MNIDNYGGYFHDGSIIDIFHDNSTLVLSMDSAEISPEENLDNILLSEQRTIKGKLHLEGVESITESETEGEKAVHGHLKMLQDFAEILHLKIHGTTVKLGLEWVNLPPKKAVSAYSFYTIKAKKVWWENIPDLYDPFW